MSDDFDSLAHGQPDTVPLTNTRIIVIMAVLGVVGTVAGFTFKSAAFGTGLLVGVALAFVNYYWLRHSLATIFAAADSGEKPRMLAGRYFLRYLILGVIVAIIYASDWVPIGAVVLGMAGIGFAVVIEGILRIIGFAQNPEQ